MSTESAPPAEGAGTPGGAELFDEEFVDNYEMLTGNTDQYSLSEKMVHHCGGAILPVHWVACKAVLAFYAGSGVSKLKTTTKANKEASCLELYYNTLESLDEEHFDKSARDFFCHSFQKKDEPMPAHSLYRYYHDSRAVVRTQVLPFFPRDLVTMKSGRGFHETCNEVYVKAYRKEMSAIVLKDGSPKYNNRELEELTPPQHWEFSKKPWYFGLLVKIFRRDPQLAPHVASVMNDVTNRPVSRAAMMRDKQRKMLQQRANAAATVSTSSPTDSSVLTSSSSTDAASTSKSAVEHNNRSDSSSADCNNDKLLWEKLLTSKAHAETTNIAKRMGKMEELERGMALLEKMRPVIGERTYADRVRSLFSSLPNFKGFDAAVDIINVESAVDRTPLQVDFEKWTTTKRTRAATKKNSNEAVVAASDKDDNNNNSDNNSSDEEDNYYRTGEEEAKYITYHDITDKNGNVVAVKAIDSRAPLDA